MAHYDEQRERELDKIDSEKARYATQRVMSFIESAEAADFIFLDSIIRNRKNIEMIISGINGLNANISSI